MDESVRRTLDTLRAVLEASPDAIVSLDLNSRVTTYNEGAERMFGWTAEEVVGTYPPSVPEDRKDDASNVGRRVKSGELISAVSVEAQCKDGRRITMSLSAAGLHDPEGRCSGLVLNLLHITERARPRRRCRRAI